MLWNNCVQVSLWVEVFLLPHHSSFSTVVFRLHRRCLLSVCTLKFKGSPRVRAFEATWHALVFDREGHRSFERLEGAWV